MTAIARFWQSVCNVLHELWYGDPRLDSEEPHPILGTADTPIRDLERNRRKW